MIIYLILVVHSKVLVIDDLNLAKNTSSDLIKQNILKSIQNKISNDGEEVVIYNDKNNTRISSKDYDKKVEIDIPVIEQGKLIRKMEEYEKSVKYLKNLIENKNENNKSPIINDRNNNRNTNNGNIPFNITKEQPSYTPQRPLSSQILDQPSYPSQQHGLSQPSYTPQRPLSSQILDLSLPAYDSQQTDQPSYPSQYSSQPAYTSYIPDLYNTNLDPYSLNSPIENLYKIPEPTDKLKLTKIKEQQNLKKAIANRKEYVRLKMQEIEDIKNKLKLQMSNYRDKVSELLNKIKNLEKYKTDLIQKVTNEKNHINNLRLNTEKVNDKKEHVLSYIRITKNEVQKYKNMLENESNKLNMLEKQYDVYDDTLKKYGEDIHKETEDIYKFTKEFQKNKHNLAHLTNLYKDYYKKNQQIDEEIKRYEKIEGCLGAEESPMTLEPVV